MGQVSINVDSHIARKLEKLSHLIGDQNTILDSFFEYQRQKAAHEALLLMADLEGYEQQYNMSSLTFYEAFTSGQLEDNQDFIIWAGLFEMWQASQKTLEALS